MRFPVITLLLVCLVHAVTAVAQGATDYNALHGVFKASSAVAGFDRLLAIPKIQSKNPAVAANSISIVIRSRNGDIQVPIDSQGRAAFPLSEALVAENPRVVSNQPSGSLRVSLVVEVKPPAQVRVTYAELAQAMADVEAAMRKLGEGYASGAIEGLEFRFDSTAGAQMSISASDHEELLMADPSGRVFLRREGSARSSDSIVAFSAPPRQVLPRVAKQP